MERVNFNYRRRSRIFEGDIAGHFESDIVILLVENKTNKPAFTYLHNISLIYTEWGPVQ